MFATKTASEIGDDDAHLVLRQMKGPGQFAPMAKWILSRSPNGQFAFIPFGDGRPRFQRSMLYVGHLVNLAQRFFGVRNFFGERIARHATLRFGA
jgi:hypothetical protein